MSLAACCRWATVTAIVAASLTAFAAPAEVMVVVTVTGAPAGSGCLRPAITGLLGARGIGVRWAPLDAAALTALGARLVLLGVDLSSPARALLSFGLAGGAAPVHREVPLGHGLDEAGCEAVAEVIDSSLPSLLAPPAMPPTPPLPPSPLPLPVAVRPPSDAAMGSSRASVGVSYGLRLVDWPSPASTVTVDLGYRRAPSRTRGSISLGYQPPFTIDFPTVRARWQSLSLRVGGSQATRGDRVWLESGTAVGLDVAYISASATIPGAIASPPTTMTTMTWQVRTTLGFRLAPHQALTVTLFWDMSFNPRRLVVYDGAAQSVFRPWWIQPGLAVGGRWL